MDYDDENDYSPIDVMRKIVITLKSHLRELNQHHVDNHGDVKCTGCDKLFKTPSSMKCHAYCHDTSPLCAMCAMKDSLLKVN